MLRLSSVTYANDIEYKQEVRRGARVLRSHSSDDSQYRRCVQFWKNVEEARRMLTANEAAG